MKTIILVLFVSVVSFAQMKDTVFYSDSSFLVTSQKLILGATMQPSLIPNAVYIGGAKITFGNNKIDISYDKCVTVSKAAKDFFDFLKTYIEKNYWIIKKEKHDLKFWEKFYNELDEIIERAAQKTDLIFYKNKRK